MAFCDPLSIRLIDYASEERRAVDPRDHKQERPVKREIHRLRLLDHRRRFLREYRIRRSLTAVLINLHARGMLRLREDKSLIQPQRREIRRLGVEHIRDAKRLQGILQVEIGIFAYCVCDQPPFATRKLSASSDWSRSSGVFPSSGRSSHIVPLPSIERPTAEKPSP